jgi:cytochrome P450
MGAAVDEITVEELVRDPYEVYRRLRDAGPCVWLAPARRFVVPRWDDVFALDENPAFHRGGARLADDARDGLSMLRTDGKDHQRQRRAAHRVLRAKEFETYWSGMLAGVADELIDEIEEAGRADLVRDFAGPYTARTLKLMLGLDDVVDTDMQVWSQALIDGIGNYADDASVWHRCREAGAGIDAAVARARDHACEGTVIHAVLSDEAVTYDEVLANVKLFISGGLNEPRDVIATTTWALLRDSEQAALVRADLIAFAAATEESLRWMSPIAMYPCYVSSDTRLGDVELAAGSRVGVLLASANRDERHWEEPDRFDLPLATQRHVAFSRGPHVCLGAFVARQQVGRAAPPRLFERLSRPSPRHGVRAAAGRLGVPGVGQSRGHLGPLTAANVTSPLSP